MTAITDPGYRAPVFTDGNDNGSNVSHGRIVEEVQQSAILLYFVAIASFPLRLAVSAVILFLLAAISWRWFESPILRLGAAVPYRVSGREPTTASLAS